MPTEHEAGPRIQEFLEQHILSFEKIAAFIEGIYTTLSADPREGLKQQYLDAIYQSAYFGNPTKVINASASTIRDFPTYLQDACDAKPLRANARIALRSASATGLATAYYLMAWLQKKPDAELTAIGFSTDFKTSCDTMLRGIEDLIHAANLSIYQDSTVQDFIKDRCQAIEEDGKRTLQQITSATRLGTTDASKFHCVVAPLMGETAEAWDARTRNVAETLLSTFDTHTASINHISPGMFEVSGTPMSRALQTLLDDIVKSRSPVATP